MRRYAMKVDVTQKPIVDALRQCGDKVDIIGRPVDLLIRTHAKYWTAEVKTPGGNAKRRQPAQVEHAQDARLNQAPHYVLDSVNAALEARYAVVCRA